MRITGIVAVGVSALVAVGCSGMMPLAPTAPSAALADAIRQPGAGPEAPRPAGPAPVSSAQAIRGEVEPMGAGAPPCWADRYPCQVYDFTLPREGSIEVTLTWDGDPRALMVQLYWAGEGLAHEDIAPREGPSRIHFQRFRMEAHAYRLRVVSLQPGTAIPFTLTITY